MALFAKLTYKGVPLPFLYDCYHNDWFLQLECAAWVTKEASRRK